MYASVCIFVPAELFDENTNILNTKEIDIPNQTLEYTYPNNLEVIYLLDDYNYLSRTTISTNNNDEITQKEIAKKLGISRSYVSRIEKRALLKIYKKFLKERKEYCKLLLKNILRLLNQ